MTRGDQAVLNTQCESEEGGIAVVRTQCESEEAWLQ